MSGPRMVTMQGKAPDMPSDSGRTPGVFPGQISDPEQSPVFKPGPLIGEKLVNAIGKFGHGAAIGTRYVDHGDDWVMLALDQTPAMIGNVGTGVIASGPIIALMDMATSIGVWLKRGVFGPQVTLDLRVDYLRSAHPGKTIFGRGECYRLTRRVGFVRGEAHDGDPDDPIAHVAGTFMILEPRP